MGEVTLRITAKAKDEAEANALIDPMEAKVRAVQDPKAIYGVNLAGLQDALVKELTQRGLKIRHSGKLHRRLHLQADHRSPRFLCGAGRRGGRSYSNEIEEKLLGVSTRDFGFSTAPSSRETALEMARGIRSLCRRRASGSPPLASQAQEADTAEKPVGLVYILRTPAPGGKRCLNFTWPGSPLPCGRTSAIASSHALYQALLTARMKTVQIFNQSSKNRWITP